MSHLDDDTLPVHPHTGLTAIGLRRNGAPIWPVFGASPDAEADDAEDAEGGDDETDGPDDAGADQLGDAGKKALDAMKAKWQKERDARKALAAENATLKAKPADKPDGTKTEPDEKAIRDQAKADARAEVARERALDRVEAKAARLFADPEDARALLASQVDDFLDGGDVDNDAIVEALNELLEKKPHLAATAGKRFTGGADGGARKGSGKPAQLTEQDLKRMKPEQIVAAQEKGLLDDLLGIS